jgi:hypothetical protein
LDPDTLNPALPDPDPVAMKWTIFLQDQLHLIKIAFALHKNTLVLEPVT